MKSGKTKNNSDFFARFYPVPLVSLGALAATFIVAVAAVSFAAKLKIFASIIFIYLLFCWWIYFRQTESGEEKTDAVFDEETEARLLALEEVNRFFGASLNSADMFRLVTSRVNQIAPCADCVLYLIDETGEHLKIADAAAEMKLRVGAKINLRTGIEGKCFQSRQPQTGTISDFQYADSKNGFSAVIVPLAHGADCFGALALFGKTANEFDERSLPLVEAVGERVAPLLIRSKRVDETITSALTDALTTLPNERGFFLVLENQIAESQRFHGDRPLSVLTVDIKNFAEHNNRFGHATGDRLLLFVADKIKNQLRQMDFLARSNADEFLAVLPTASEETTQEIVERIERVFVTNPFEASETEAVHLQLCFGWASFGADGETATELLKRARIRKQQAKSARADSNVIWFPKEFIN